MTRISVKNEFSQTLKDATMTMNETQNQFTLPSLIATWRIPYNSLHGQDDHQFYDVKFWPYFDTTHSSPIFATVGCRDIVISRIRTEGTESFTETLHALRDEEEEGPERLPILNTCCWVYIDESNPLLAVSGPSGQIKLIDAINGTLFTTLTGHGTGLINDLAAHPLYPWILASASIDSSIRIWDLRRWKDKYESPCIIICGQGQGHQAGLLSISWHSSGRYIVSGAHDNLVCLWTIPDLADSSAFWTSISPAARKTKSDAVHIIHYPHFVTAAVHSNYIDCVCFFGDMILSKAASEDDTNAIILWEISGFDSSLPPPPPELAPKIGEHKDTRSCFKATREMPQVENGDNQPAFETPEASEAPLYVQHLSFDLPHTQCFYLRFGVLAPSRAHPTLHPVLACGNTEGQIFMWDMRRMMLGHTDGYQTLPVTGTPKHETYIEIAKKIKKKQTKHQKEQRVPTPDRQLIGSQNSSNPDAPADSPAPRPQVVPNRERYPISRPFVPVKPHKTIVLPDEMRSANEHRTTCRGVSWSPCGRWCVVVGDHPGSKENKRDAQGVLLSRWV